jgi:hypothetical protein
MGTLIALSSPGALAGPWSIEPRLGVSADYDTNPGLREVDAVSEEHVAALFNLPLRYDADDVELALMPSGRLSNSSGYSSLASNYLHLDLSAQFINDLGSTSVQGGVARDSSLYHAGELVNGVGVRRDSAVTAVDWTRSITERIQTQLDANWSRVTYDQPPNATVLVDYRYISGGPTLAYALSERNTLKLLGNYGVYNSLDGITESKSRNLQLGLVRQLSELWSLSANLGYSRSQNSQKIFFGPFFLGTESFDQSDAVYSVNLSRQGEKLNLSAGISRAELPTGLAFLSRQDGANLSAVYKYTERWDFSATAAYERAQNPTLTGAVTSVRYLNAQATANWHWTPEWIVSLHAGRINQTLGSPAFTVGSTGVSLDIVRQFLRKHF